MDTKLIELTHIIQTKMFLALAADSLQIHSVFHIQPLLHTYPNE